MNKLIDVVLTVIILLEKVDCYSDFDQDVKINIDTTTVINKVEDYYLSFNIDTSEFQVGNRKLNYSSTRLRTLMHALSPALLRIGGSGADYLFFNRPLKVILAAGLTPTPSVITKKDFENLVDLTRSTGNRLLFDLNLQQRQGNQWDPSGAIELFEFCVEKGFGENIDWELGNEPDDYVLYPKGETVLTPKQIGEDYVRLKKVVDQYPIFANSSIFGPDIGGNTQGTSIIVGVANYSGSFLKAITFHQYYFRGDVATYKDYLNPSYFNSLVATINNVKNAMKQSKYPNIPLWIGETSDAWHSGTPNVSDRFVSGFLWMEKLGLSAQMGIKVVMRQTLYIGSYSLLDMDLNPNPDYWLSLVFRTLVGLEVLSVTSSQSWDVPDLTTRVYAHCTNKRAGYKPGAVTVFALNISPDITKHLVFVDTALKVVDIYMMTADGPDGVLSKYVNLNGQRLMMQSDSTMPPLTPVRQVGGQPVHMAPLSYTFLVFPNAAASVCM